MKRLLWSAGALACLLPAAAAASTCEALYRAKGGPALKAWHDLGEVNGPKKDSHCLAKTRNQLGNLDAKALGLTKAKVCAAGGKISVSLSFRVDGKKIEPAPPDVLTALGAVCPKAP